MVPKPDLTKGTWDQSGFGPPCDEGVYVTPLYLKITRTHTQSSDLFLVDPFRVMMNRRLRTLLDPVDLIRQLENALQGLLARKYPPTLRFIAQPNNSWLQDHRSANALLIFFLLMQLCVLNKTLKISVIP
ncbi:hypothetical protein TNCV_3319341 [Trichonephila clavipes]|nr:hypothetical protein TNCV_3319341 [Trichonephila clavipes]